MKIFSSYISQIVLLTFLITPLSWSQTNTLSLLDEPPPPEDFLLADVNGDTANDLVSIKKKGISVTYLGTGTGYFAKEGITHIPEITGFNAANSHQSIADVTSDGLADKVLILHSPRGNKLILVYTGQANGGFSSDPLPSDPSPDPVCPTTLNSDKHWFTTDAFKDVERISVQVIFTNISSNNLVFSNEITPNIWSIPDREKPPFDFQYGPIDTEIEPNATFVFVAKIDVSTLNDINDKLAFQIITKDQKPLTPDHISVNRISFRCN
ncbi:FG-GAP repeat domain-containing protein [Zooshikella sp. RANM57]|uniref:FG-GAP repeat domain-containing protein n=1 Tax=Zooshikella sp. RANM57 TaxID=3425863 RepID=UPI003D6E9F24